MGMSGAYGGSGSAAWDQAHELYEQAGGGAPGPPPPVPELVEALVAAIGRAKPHPSAPASYAAPGLRPSRPGGTDGCTRSRTAGPAPGAGAGFTRRAARGASAVAGAQAYRARDSGALADLGLDLTRLDALPSDRARCTAIADALLGAPAHPDDAALKAAAIQTMVDALKSSDEIDSERVVEMFTANLAYEQVLVELTSQQRDTAVPAVEAAKIEKQMKKYIRTSVRARPGKAPRRLDPQALIDRAAGLAAKVLGIFGRKR